MTKIADFHERIEALVPGADYEGVASTEEEYPVVRWNDARPQPTWAEIVAPNVGIEKQRALVRLRRVFNAICETHYAGLTGIEHTAPGSLTRAAGIAYHMTRAAEQAWIVSAFQTATQKKNAIQATTTVAKLEAYLAANPLDEGWPT